MFGFGSSKETTPQQIQGEESHSSDLLYGGSASDSETKKSQLMALIQKQKASENMMVLVKKMNHSCFDSCIDKPGMTLASSESVMLTNTFL